MSPIVVETEELRSCPGCKGGRLKSWRVGRDRLHGVSEQQFRYAKCRECGLIFLSLRPLETEAHKFYPENYGPYRAGQTNETNGGAPKVATPTRGGVVRRLANNSLGRILNSINSRVDKLFPVTVPAKLAEYYLPKGHGLKLLDFGCGSDAFLNEAAARGWDTIGVDFSQATVERVAASGHRALLVSPGMWDEIPDESLDFVRLSHVLEHLYSPPEVLLRLKQKMKSGATMHVAVPNPLSLSSRIFRSRWWGLECPRHVSLYSSPALRRALGDLGFTEIEVLHEVVTKDFVRSLGYLMSDMGRIKQSEVESLMHREDLARLFHLPARIAAALGLADRYHVFARK